jgi:transposase
MCDSGGEIKQCYLSQTVGRSYASICLTCIWPTKLYISTCNFYLSFIFQCYKLLKF